MISGIPPPGGFRPPPKVLPRPQTVTPGTGMISKMAKSIANMDMANGVDRTTGHALHHINLLPSYNRFARGGRPGSVSTAESLGPMSGPLR